MGADARRIHLGGFRMVDEKRDAPANKKKPDRDRDKKAAVAVNDRAGAGKDHIPAGRNILPSHRPRAGVRVRG